MTVIGVMLSIFYWQYNRTAAELLVVSVAEHKSILESSFERRSRSQLHQIANRFADLSDANDTIAIQSVLND